MRSRSGPALNTATGRDVLVVEDDPRVRHMLAQALKEMAFPATFAASGEIALKHVGERKFDILILDLNLPGMGGIELLERVRKLGNDIPTIILTGFGDLEAAKKAIHLDVVEFLTKPCALGSLEQALARARQRRKEQVIDDAATAVETALRIEPTAFQPPAQGPDAAGELSMEEIERRHILAVLKKHDGNRAASAAELGISVRKLYYRLGEYQRKGLLS